MTYPYIPATDDDKKEMLEKIGIDTVEELFRDIPEDFRLKEDLKLQKHKSEEEVISYLKKLSDENANTSQYTCFLGAGAYDHYIPTLVNSLVQRSEFFTAYTPYQPEISQGSLQAIFEFQSLIANLTDMDFANASLYDGGTAVTEAALLACRSSRKEKILVSETIHPSSLEILKSYCKLQDIELVIVGSKNGKTDRKDLEEKLDQESAGLIVQSPNFLGYIEDIEEITEFVHKINKKMTMVMATDPFSLGLLKTPGEMDVDVVVGEGQSLGIPLSFGGPYLGIMAAKNKYMRKVPGRLIGQTVDKDNKRSFVLTLAAREQHIKRAKATSNICTNQGLMALTSTIYMATMGKEGMREAAMKAFKLAHYAFDRLTESGKFKPVYDNDFFIEFALESEIDPEIINKKLFENGIIGGLSLAKYLPDHKNAILYAVTEKRSKEEIDKLVDLLEEI